MLNQRTSILSFLLLLVAAPALRASETEVFPALSLDELLTLQVSTVSRIPEPRDDSPGSVYVITGETIKRRGYNTLKDVLQVIPGVNVFHRDLQYVGVFRGLAANDNEKFTLLINGQELNGVNEPDFLNGPINLDTVERIEVVVGPSSMFQPANTLVATINVITKQSDTPEAVVSVGSERKYSTSVSGGKTWEDDIKIHVSATIEERNGFDAWDRNRSIAPMTRNAGSDVTGKSLEPDHFIVVNGQYRDWSMQLTSYQSKFHELRYPPAANPYYLDMLRGIEIKHQHEVNDDWSTLLKLSTVYKKMDRHASLPARILLSQVDWNAEAGLTYTGLEKHTLQGGVQFVFEDNRDAIFRGDIPPEKTFYSEDTRGLGIYLDEQYSVNDQLKLIAGLRMDYNTLVGNQVYPSGRAAAIYHVTDHWTSKFIVNKSTRMPSPLAALNDIWGAGKPNAPPFAGSSPNADKPEELVTLEWSNILYLQRTRLALNLYIQHLYNFITWGAPYSNVGEYEGWGAELTADHKVNGWLNLWGNLSFIQSAFDTSDSFDTAAVNANAHQAIDDSDRLIGAPQLTANTGVDADITDNILFSTQLRYFTMQPTEVTQDGGNTFEFTETNNRFYLDASLLFEDVLRPKLDIRVSGKNLLDNRDPVGGPWLRGSYLPRGATLEVALYLEF